MNCKIYISIIISIVLSGFQSALPQTSSEISNTAELEIAQRKDETAVSKIPHKKIFFRPYISANLPAGSKNATDAKIMALLTQPSKTASMANSLPIVGSATFTPVIIIEPTNVAIETIINATLLLTTTLTRSTISFNIPDLNKRTFSSHASTALARQSSGGIWRL